MKPENYDLDLGDDHFLTFTPWAPDRTIPSNAERYRDVPDEPFFGALIDHNKPDGTECHGAVTFDGPVTQQVEHGPRWTVESREPLTISPSILCLTCGDHGFIRNGKWVRA